MNKLQRRKIKRTANLKLLFFTFLGAFILFFVAFTHILSVVTPQVEIPALTEDHVFNSITSHDFKGRIDPRLHSIELKEELPPKIKPKEEKEEETSPVPATGNVDSISNEDKWLQDSLKTEKKTTEEKSHVPLPGAEKKALPLQKPSVNIPPKPRPLANKQKIVIAPPAPVFQAKVIVGNFSSPKEAKITSDILLNLDFEPFIRERNGKYILQVGAFSKTEEAKTMVQELKNRNFDAKIIYE